jgi:carbonic anhydrase
MAWDDLFLERNRALVERGPAAGPPLPRHGLVILTCMDHRIDPVAALGLGLGDAMVIRNAGGRVTPAFLENLKVLDLVARQRGSGLAELEIVLMQHTGCGAAALAETDAEALAAYLGVELQRLEERSPVNPRAGVRADIDLLAGAPAIPASLSVTGLVYETDSGRVEVVERRSPLRDQA